MKTNGKKNLRTQEGDADLLGFSELTFPKKKESARTSICY